MWIHQPKVSLPFGCAICVELHMHCAWHSCISLIISSRLIYCGNWESSVNKHFARLRRSYHTQYWVNELKVQLSMSTEVILSKDYSSDIAMKEWITLGAIYQLQEVQFHIRIGLIEIFISQSFPRVKLAK